MEGIVCLVPELRREKHHGSGTQHFKRMQCFYIATVNVSVYYRVT